MACEYIQNMVYNMDMIKLYVPIPMEKLIIQAQHPPPPITSALNPSFKCQHINM